MFAPDAKIAMPERLTFRVSGNPQDLHDIGSIVSHRVTDDGTAIEITVDIEDPVFAEHFRKERADLGYSYTVHHGEAKIIDVDAWVRSVMTATDG